MSSVSCTAIIVTYQSAAHVGALLESIGAELDSGINLEVLVVDNGSTDGTPSVVARFEWAKLVHSGGNLGYAAGVNLGSSLVPRNRAVLILNPDLVLKPGAIPALLKGLDQPGVGVVVPRMSDAEGQLVPSLRNEPSIRRRFTDALLGSRAARLPTGWSGMVWDPRAYEGEQYPDWAMGAALLISSQCRITVGDWDERYFLYCEETDFMRRVREAGLLVRYEPTAAVRHVMGGSGTSDGLYALGFVNVVEYYRRYHRQLSSAVYTANVMLFLLLRAGRRADRLALYALLSRSVRSTLPRPTPPEVRAKAVLAVTLPKRI